MHETETQNILLSSGSWDGTAESSREARTSWRAVAKVREHPVVVLRAAKDVGGFEVAVRVATCMQRLQTPPDLPYHLQCNSQLPERPVLMQKYDRPCLARIQYDG